ncbi:MAG: tyrosine--tRNA ligase, partial [Chthoniobacterales bacterium]
LDKDKTEVRRNSEWLDKMSSQEIVRLCGRYSLARMLEREDFRSRLNQHQPISVHELLYPLLTAVDAVQLKSDVEIGATEQKFNLLIHRDIQREYGLEGEVALTMPILVGLDGARKMSKSLGNYIGITEPPNDMFGKIMRIPDEPMWLYWDLLTDRSPGELGELLRQVKDGAINPKEVKMRLAREITSDFHGTGAAQKAAEYFQRVFSDRQAPAEMREQLLACGPPTRLWTLVRISELVSSRSEAERLIKQRAVEIDGVVIDDPTRVIDVTKPTSFVLRVGKKDYVRFVVTLPPDRNS